jgi:hypothetical protein
MPTQPYYLKDGTRVPGVTTILSKRRDPGGLMHWAWQCGVDGIDYRKARDEAANAGTLVHSMVEEQIHGRDPEKVLYVGTFDGIGKPHAINPEIAKAARVGFKAYLGWLSETRIQFEKTEFPLVSEMYKFGGTPDAVGRLSGGDLVLLDFKTGRTYPDHLTQISAYKHLWNENNEEQVTSAHLLRFDKTYGVPTHKFFGNAQLEVAWEAFKHLLTLYELDKELGRMSK